MINVPPPFMGSGSPEPDKNRFNLKEVAIDKKIPMLVLQVLALGLASLLVWLVAYSRESTNERVITDVHHEWGNPLAIRTPYLYQSQVSYPEFCNIDVAVEAKTLHRQIYDVEVYNAQVNITGQYTITDPVDTLKLKLPSLPKRAELQPLEIDGKSYSWQMKDDYVYAYVPVDSSVTKVTFALNYATRGSSKISVDAMSPSTKVIMHGDASNPSFKGNLLPTERNMTAKTFEATWLLTKHDVIETKFLVGVDQYLKVERSIKYAILVVILTYISVLFSEITMRKPIPLLNYFLIGAALIIFYTLLLSIAEHIAFWAAYLIAVVMTVGLITIYIYRILSSWKAALMVCAILTFIYAICYMLLNLQVYSLMIGSLTLFFAVAVMMYASLKVKIQ